MKGFLFKSIPGDDPVQATQAVQDDVNRWAEKQEGVKPISCWSACATRWSAPASMSITPPCGAPGSEARAFVSRQNVQQVH
jgi:hypothetical protein